MSLKFTRRRNQRQMTTITAKHHLGGYEMLRLLARFQTGGLPDVDGPDWDTGRPGEDLSKQAVEHIVRQAIDEYGRDAYLSEDDPLRDYTAPEAWHILTWAARQIRRHFPDTIDHEFINYERELHDAFLSSGNEQV
jgi:hypothetical protein